MEIEVKIVDEFLNPTQYFKLEQKLSAFYSDGWECQKYKINTHPTITGIRIIAILHRKIDKLNQQES